MVASTRKSDAKMRVRMKCRNFIIGASVYGRSES